MPEEPEWATEAQREWRNYINANPDLATPKRDGKILSELLTSVLGAKIEAASGEIRLHRLTFRLERNPPNWMGEGPVAVIPGVCPVCGQEVLREVENLLAVGAALAGETVSHHCPGKESRVARKNEAEEALIQALKVFVETSGDN